MRKTAMLALLLGAGLGADARASTPQTIYSDVRRIELLPSDASATRVVITGAFFKLVDGGGYGDPACGYMYFECRAGEEAMCRMQWRELRDVYLGSAETCAGFGQMNVVSSAKVYPVGTPLGAPDRWDLGTGIAPGVSVSNKCPAAKKLSCQLDAPDLGGAADLAQPAPDLARPPTTPGGGGCSLGGGAGAGAPALALAAGLWLLRRRRGRPEADPSGRAAGGPPGWND